MTSQPTLYRIPAPRMAQFEADMQKLSRRSERLIGQPIKPEVVGTSIENQGTAKEMVYVHVNLVAETPKIDGWVFAARIDHANETGNIVRTVPNISCEIPAHYRTAKPDCDHCQARRQRRDTFVLWNPETGEFQQVGRNCLKDFFGHDPHKIARLAEFLGFATEIAAASEEYDEARHGGMVDHRWIDVENYLAWVARSIRLNGWLSATKAREIENQTGAYTPATRDLAFEDMRRKHRPHDAIPTDADRKLAEAALEWARELSTRDDLNDYEHNIAVVAGSSYAEYRSIGLAASIIFAYQKDATLRQEIADLWIGEEGKKVRGEATVQTVFGFESDHGWKTIVIFRAVSNGAQLKWTTTVEHGLAQGDRVIVAGTVQKHDTYKGRKQTVLTRCKIEKAA